MRLILVLFTLLTTVIISPFGYGKTVKTHAFVDAAEAFYNGNICWYDNKRYSKGAMIQVHSFNLICTSGDPFNKNSELIWLKLDKNGNVVYPSTPKTITVN